MSWFLNPALTRFRNEVNSRWPRRDKTSDGTIGDTAHAARSSDHNPDADGSVDAWDMDVDGPDIAACKRAFEAHEASSYWIHNDQISFRSEGWAPRSYAYAGPNRNRHDKHCHWNSRQSHETSNKPWFTDPPEDDDVTAQEVWDAPMTAGETGVKAPAAAFLRAADVMRKKDLPRIELTLAAILTAVKGDADRAAILARIDQRAGELAADIADVDDQVVNKLGAASSPEEKAALLRVALGDDAAAVGVLLAQG